MWQSRVEIEDYSVRNISRKTRLMLAVVYLVLMTIVLNVATIVLNVGFSQAICTLVLIVLDLGGNCQLSVVLEEARSTSIKSSCFVHGHGYKLE